MKKKNIVIGIIIAILLVMGCMFLINRTKLIGNMENHYTEKTTLNSEISFAAEAGDRVKLSFQSKIESGSLDMILYNSAGDAVYELDKASALETFYTFENADTYVLTAECKDLIGSYAIKVVSATK